MATIPPPIETLYDQIVVAETPSSFGPAVRPFAGASQISVERPLYRLLNATMFWLSAAVWRSIAARCIHRNNDEIISAIWSGIDIETILCRKHGRSCCPKPEADAPVTLQTAFFTVRIPMPFVAVFIVISIFGAVPIFAFGGLPAEDRARVVLQGDQGLNRAEARIDNMAPAPVLDDAVRMIFLMIRILCVIFFLSVSCKVKKAEGENGA